MLRLAMSDDRAQKLFIVMTNTLLCELWIANYIIINVYMFTPDRLLICDDLLTDIWSWRDHYKDCQCIIAGNFNVDLQSNDIVAHRIQSFIQDCSLMRHDILFPSANVNLTPTAI